jgi:RNA polymerase sigma-70 factor (ECF subfamily)
VQETLVRAWRASGQFESRTPLRHWLYRIATNVSLTMLAHRTAAHRAMPHLVAPRSNGRPVGPRATDVPWLEPYPDAALESIPDDAPGPHARYEIREATQLAFVAAIQYLPPRQRATLLLRDVLGWSSAETARALDASVPSINSALQRARETLKKRSAAEGTSPASGAGNERERRLLERYVQTWEARDLTAFVTLLREDAVLTMPPVREWYQGRRAIRELLAWAWEATGYEGHRLVPVAANYQPSFALYGRENARAPWEAHAIHVLTLSDEGIAVLSNFLDTGLFVTFGLPLRLEA